MIRCVKKPTNAFVTYSSQSSAKRAIQEGSYFQNSKLNIRYHTSKPESENLSSTFKAPNFIVNKPPSKLGFATPVLDNDNSNKTGNFNTKPSFQITSKPITTSKPTLSFSVNKPIHPPSNVVPSFNKNNNNKSSVPSSKNSKPPSFIISKPLATSKQPARLFSKNGPLKPTPAPKQINEISNFEGHDNIDLLGDAYDVSGEEGDEDNSFQDEDNEVDKDEDIDEDDVGINESAGFADDEDLEIDNNDDILE